VKALTMVEAAEAQDVDDARDDDGEWSFTDTGGDFMGDTSTPQVRRNREGGRELHPTMA
jgi:hypothetical protein